MRHQMRLRGRVLADVTREHGARLAIPREHELPDEDSEHTCRIAVSTLRHHGHN